VVQAQEGANDPTPAQVRTAAEAFDKGREAYKAEDYIEAAEQFEKADNNAASSAAIELAIRARDKAGELDRAASLAALALKRHPDDPNLQRIVPDILNRASQQLFELTAACDSPCDLTVGGKIVHGPAATERLFFVAPGKVNVRAGWLDNRNESKQIEGEAGGHGQLSFVAPPVAAPAAAPPIEATKSSPPLAPTSDSGVTAQAKGWSPVVFWVGVGATAVVSGVTIWSGVDTISNPGTERVERECKGQGESCPLYQEGRKKQLRTNVLLGVSGGLGVATILIGAFATNWSGGGKTPASAASADRPQTFSVSPWASIEGGGLQALGRF